MSINFVQETGTGSSTSTSYASVAQYKQYWLDRGTLITDPDDSIKAYLNQATEYIDSKYVFMGEVINLEQSLSFPRVGVMTKNRVIVDSDTVPKEVINATCYLGAEAKKNNLNRIDENVKSLSYGPVSKTFSMSADSISFPVVDRYLSAFTISGTSMVRVN
jgi:hypothetical protein